MSSKLKIFQYHNVHLYNLKQYRIALEVGVYSDMCIQIVYRIWVR